MVTEQHTERVQYSSVSVTTFLSRVALQTEQTELYTIAAPRIKGIPYLLVLSYSWVFPESFCKELALDKNQSYLWKRRLGLDHSSRSCCSLCCKDLALACLLEGRRSLTLAADDDARSLARCETSRLRDFDARALDVKGCSSLLGGGVMKGRGQRSR